MLTMSLVRNIGNEAVGGVTLGLVSVVNRFVVYGTPVYDLVVRSFGRYGEGIFGMVMGLVLDFASSRVPQLQTLRLPARWFIYGVYKVTEEAVAALTGRGFTVVQSDGSVKTDPADTVTKIYMQDGDTVTEVVPGSPASTFGAVKYVAVGSKRVYYFEAPYKLPAATASSSR